MLYFLVVIIIVRIAVARIKVLIWMETIDWTVKEWIARALDSFDVMWFAWAAYYPKTEIY